jgi:hypothetical protein
MSALSIRLLRAAAVCLALGVVLGACFGLDRALGARLRPLHAELNLWGWLTLLIYGMGYHMLPRFAGRALGRPSLAAPQAALAVTGVALAALGWLASAADWPMARPLLVAGGALELGAALLFVGLMAPLVWGRKG